MTPAKTADDAATDVPDDASKKPAKAAALAMGTIVSHVDNFGRTRYGLVVDTADTHPDGKPAKTAAGPVSDENPEGVEPQAVGLVRVGWFGEVSDAIPESEVIAVSEGSTDTAAQAAQRRGWKS